MELDYQWQTYTYVHNAASKEVCETFVNSTFTLYLELIIMLHGLLTPHSNKLVEVTPPHPNELLELASPHPNKLIELETPTN